MSVETAVDDVQLTPRDLALLGGGVLLALLLAYVTHVGSLPSSAVDVLRTWIPRLAVVAILVGVAFVYLARDRFGGEIARGLNVIAAGFLIYGVVYWPHKVAWHGGGEPAWLVLSSGAWQTFFHLLTVTTLGVVAYGFYLFWRTGKGATGGDESHDAVVVGGAVATAALAGVWADLMNVGTQVDAFIDFFTVIAVIVALYFIYLSRTLLGGTLGRDLEVVGTGLSLYVVNYWASYRWSTAGSPEWLGVSAAAWDILFSLVTLVTFAYLAYGFYLFYESGTDPAAPA